MSSEGPDRTHVPIVAALAVVCLGLAAAGMVGWIDAPGASSPADEPAKATSIDPGNETIEDEYVEPAPERGDEYFEAAAADGSWISYVNPRDRYRSPYLGDGSGKICATLLNEAGEVVVGESIPGTTVTVPTGESIAWHEDADPMTVEYPLTANYERPLDSDQFGTSPDLPQGDGYMDAHCIEIHGLPEDGGTVEYGQVEVDGEYADWIDVVGYIQQAHVPGWDTSVDPIADAESYEEAGGGWTYRTDASHGQVVVVLQLDPPASAYPSDGTADDGTADDGTADDGTTDDGTADDGATDGGTEDGGSADDGTAGNGASDDGTADDGSTGSPDVSDGGSAADDGSDDSVDGGASDGADGTASDDDAGSTAEPDGDGSPGFGVLVALVALSTAALARAVR